MKTAKLFDYNETPESISRQIKSGKYKKQKMDIKQFFRKIGDNDYFPKEDTRIQVRETDRDISRIERAVHKMKASGDTSKLEPLTIVYYPDDNVYKLANGNHTAEMAINMGIEEMDVHVVNYKTQLGSKHSNVMRLGNCLNKVEVEKIDVSDDDIKNEFFQLMDERVEEGLSPIPTEEEKQNFVETYPQITKATIGQWVSHHGTAGSRRSPKKTYTNAELDNQRQSFKNDLDYIDYAVTAPRTLSSWSDTGISAIFNDCMVEGKRKALVIFYCSTVNQVDALINTDIRDRIKTKYKELSEFWNIKIDTVFLRYE